jgi:hypothetical protein
VSWLKGKQSVETGQNPPDTVQALVLQRHFALPGSAASALGTLQRILIIFATL